MDLKPASDKGLKDWGKETLSLLSEARDQKREVSPRFKEGYFVATPYRERAMESDTQNNAPNDDDGEFNTSFGTELSEDFVTLIINTFLPEAEPWAAREPGWTLPDEQQDELKRQLKAGDEIVFKAVKSSNFYAECAKGFMPDLPIGTVAMWIEDPAPYQPIHCQAVPLHEVEILLGPDGNIDFRALVRHVRNRQIPALLKGMTLPDAIKDKIKRQPNHKSKVSRCFWRDWNEAGDVVWHYTVMVGQDCIDHKMLRGVGSCPLIVARFGPCPEWPYGFGPLLKAMPDLRQYESLDRDRTDHSQMSLTPPMAVPDDSFANFEHGLEPGMAYAIRPGTGNDIVPIYNPPPANAALYDQQAREMRLKRMFYLDWPEQQGKTPPSASQWLDQVAVALRRIGMPGLPFWKEFCAEVFMRFALICERRGAIKPAAVDGKRVSLVAYNPAFRAVEANDVAAAARFMELAGQGFPEEYKMEVDGSATMHALAEKLGATKIVMFRDPETKQAAIEGIAQLLGGQMPGAPDVGAGPAVAPAPMESAPAETRNYLRQ